MNDVGLWYTSTIAVTGNGPATTKWTVGSDGAASRYPTAPPRAEKPRWHECDICGPTWGTIRHTTWRGVPFTLCRDCWDALWLPAKRERAARAERADPVINPWYVALTVLVADALAVLCFVVWPS